MKDFVNTAGRSGIPAFFIALGVIGFAIFVLGLGAQFAGWDILSEESRVEDYPLMMIIIGFNFMIPLALQWRKTGSGKVGSGKSE
ncbi:MAG: hypothetical protein GKR95_11220 [Gammaproteobacteria bacterium]|nr:hypothetical protein [Gammaproteobacteria bacterium]